MNVPLRNDRALLDTRASLNRSDVSDIYFSLCTWIRIDIIAKTIIAIIEICH